jgi:hypothetical protein
MNRFFNGQTMFAVVMTLLFVAVPGFAKRAAEKVRRYEKEMFIYAAKVEKRVKYVKDFNDADGADILKWKEATAFYTTEFTKVAGKAETSAADPALTVTLNTDIGPGKDKFREVLDGASKMREGKEKQSQEVGADIRAGFDIALWAAVAVAVLMVLAAAFFFTPKAAPRSDARMSQLRSGLPTQGRG